MLCAAEGSYYPCKNNCIIWSIRSAVWIGRRRLEDV
jgi:hypothetical protein